MSALWILFIVFCSPGADGGITVERVQYQTQQDCVTAADSAQKALGGFLGYTGSFCLAAPREMN